MRREEKADMALPQRYWALEKVPPKRHATELVYPQSNYIDEVARKWFYRLIGRLRS